LYAKFSPALYADSLQVKKLEINFLTPSELGRHPYIGFRQAKKIVKTRATVGKFRSKEELIALFSGDSLRRLLPYLSTGSIEP
jgi:DNA uptake protein ComE-like DNA-binding protein